MIDTYLKSTNRESLEKLREFAMNVIGPVQGIAATEMEAATGDPAYWYVCIRFLLPIAPCGDIEACDSETGTAVCGVWA